LSIESANYRSNTELLGITIKNISDARFVLKNMSPYTFTNSHDLVEIPSQGSKYLEVKTDKKLSFLELDFDVLNALEAPKVTSKLTLKKRVN